MADTHGLNPTGEPEVGDCCFCGFLCRGQWFADDEAGGVRFFLCPSCLERWRRRRAAADASEALNEGELIGGPICQKHGTRS